MAMSKIGYGTPEYAEYETLGHKLWDYGLIKRMKQSL